MVAFVNGKFTNASAHTSYLILLKNMAHNKKHRGCIHFGWPLRKTRFSESPPGAGRARHYIWSSSWPSI